MRQIKLIEDNHFPRFAKLIGNAYPATNFSNSEEENQFIERLLTIQKEDEHVHYYGYYDENNDLNGSMRLHDYRMNMLGTKINVGGIGLVAVDLLRKKEKMAKEMVTFFLNHYRNHGALIALLYPFRPDFYKKMGFGYGPKMDRYLIKPSAFPSNREKSHLCYLQKEDKESIRSCFERYVNKQHGMIEKTLFELDRLFMRRDIRIIGYRNEGQLEGYIVFRFEKAHDNNMVMNNLIIEEWVYLNTEALGEFLTFLHTQDDQIHRVAVQTLDPSFYYLLHDPRNETNNVIPHVYHEMHTSGVGLMYKVLNIEGLFHALKDYNFNQVSCRMKLVVSDTFESKIHSLTIHFIEGKAMVMPSGDSDFELSLDISDFSALMMGAVTFETLHQFGLAQVSNDHYIPLIQKVFLTPQKPVCLSGF